MMKLSLVALVLALAMASAVEDSTSDLLVKICGDDLLKAFQEACEKKTLHYLLKHGVYHPDDELEVDHKHQHRDNHRRDHTHDHVHHRQDNHSNGDKNENDKSISEECCHKPCLVKDFIGYCG